MQVIRRALPLAALALLSGLPGTLRADAGNDAKAIRADYAAMSAAINRRDLSGMFAHVSPDAQFVDKSGKAAKVSEAKQQIQQVFKVAKSIKYNMTVDSVTVKGNTATVVERDHLAIVMPGGSKQPVAMTQTSKSNDTWTKTANGWLVTKSVTVEQTMTMNGKSAPGGK